MITLLPNQFQVRFGSASIPRAGKKGMPQSSLPLPPTMKMSEGSNSIAERSSSLPSEISIEEPRSARPESLKLEIPQNPIESPVEYTTSGHKEPSSSKQSSRFLFSPFGRRTSQSTGDSTFFTLSPSRKTSLATSTLQSVSPQSTPTQVGTESFYSTSNYPIPDPGFKFGPQPDTTPESRPRTTSFLKAFSSLGQRRGSTNSAQNSPSPQDPPPPAFLRRRSVFDPVGVPEGKKPLISEDNPFRVGGRNVVMAVNRALDFSPEAEASSSSRKLLSEAQKDYKGKTLTPLELPEPETHIRRIRSTTDFRQSLESLLKRNSSEADVSRYTHSRSASGTHSVRGSLHTHHRNQSSQSSFTKDLATSQELLKKLELEREQAQSPKKD